MKKITTTENVRHQLDVNNPLAQEVYRRYKGKRGYVKYLSNKLGITKAQAKIMGRALVKEIDQCEIGSDLVDKQLAEEEFNAAFVTQVEEPPAVDNSKIEEVRDAKGKLKYFYNRENGDYIFLLKSVGKKVTIKKTQMKGILRAYSNWDGDKQSIEKLSLYYGLTREAFKEIMSLYGFTHDTLPVTHEELQLQDSDEIAEDLLQALRMNVQLKFNKLNWEESQKKIEIHDKFMRWEVNPFIEAVKNIHIPAIKTLQYDSQGVVRTDKEVFMACLNDLHFGSHARAYELNQGDDYNIDKVTEIVDTYATKIQDDLNNRFVRPKNCVIAILGDILHSLTGKTQRGTVLTHDVIGQKQFEVAMLSLTRFVERMLELFEKVEVQTVRGNHAGASEGGLYYAIAQAFRNNPRVGFHIPFTRTNAFEVCGGTVVIDHGDSDIIPDKARVPGTDSKRSEYISKVMLKLHDTRKDLPSGFRLFIQGDLHHYQRKDYGSVEFLMLPAPITGDQYADHKNLGSRPSQKCFIFDSTGIKEELTYTFK